MKLDKTIDKLVAEYKKNFNLFFSGEWSEEQLTYSVTQTLQTAYQEGMRDGIKKSQ
jgi:hypothetical protein